VIVPEDIEEGSKFPVNSSRRGTLHKYSFKMFAITACILEFRALLVRWFLGEESKRAINAIKEVLTV
jgi:hypothetical protein